MGAGKAAATSHIRKLNADLARFKSQAERQAAQEKDDSEYVIQQKLRNKPVETIQEIVDKRLAADRESQQQEQEVIRRSREAQEMWVADPANANYIADAHNGKLMIDFIQATGATEVTRELCDQAFAALRDKLHLRSNTPTTSAPRRTGSSIRSSSGTVTHKTEPSESELHSMPLEKLKSLANQQLSENQE